MQMLCYHMSFGIGSFVHSLARSLPTELTGSVHIPASRLPDGTSARSYGIADLWTEPVTTVPCVYVITKALYDPLVYIEPRALIKSTK